MDNPNLSLERRRILIETLNIGAQFLKKDVLITGGLGFIGSSLAIKLCELGANVTIIDSLIPTHGGNINNIREISERVIVNYSDMRDIEALKGLVRDKDYIFHLAGQVSHGDSMLNPRNDLEVNCIATINLLESCREYNPNARLIYTSTRQVYGEVSDLPVSESQSVSPIDVNGINKLSGEYYHLLYHRTYSLKSTVLRLTNTYGPRQQIRSNRQGFVGIFIRQALQLEEIKIFGDGTQLRDFNYIDDVVDALILSSINRDCYGEIFNLGALKKYSIIQFVETIQKILPSVNYKVVNFPEARKVIDIGDYYGDFSKFHKVTGWNPKVDIETGLKHSLKFFSEHPLEYWK